ncbi:MAG: GNAT family N-acetyltransferase [Flavobacteriaceae bacterium]|nr:GNAT family N-acetyltransferase [Psychroflexus sp.]
MLENTPIHLRALEPEDLDFLFEIENLQNFWHLSDTLQPFSKQLLKDYISNAHLDIFEAKQLRMVVSLPDEAPIGFIDLYDFNPQHKRAGLGIIIHEKYHALGYGKSALKMMLNYAYNRLDLHQIYVYIHSENRKSISLFENLDFSLVGELKDWHYEKGIYSSVLVYQNIRNVH